MIDRLRAHPGITVGELAAGLGRSERTIYRWLSELTVDMGVPVFCRGGGYYLARNGNSMPELTAEELVAVRMAIKGAPLSDGSRVGAHARSAWQKIKGSAPAARLDFANELASRYSVRVTAPEGPAQDKIASQLENAIARRTRLRIVYRSQKSNEVKSYTVDPYSLVFRRHSWYLLAHCHEHGRVVQFRLARFREITDTQEVFELPPDFSADDYFASSWEAWGGGELVKVRVRFSPGVSAMVAEVQRHPSQKVFDQPDGSVIFEATVSGIQEIAIWILGFGKEAEVLDPPELRSYVAEHAIAMAKLYSQ